MSDALLTVGALVVVLGVLIFVHEMGHFLAAKWAGIWVHRFSIGLGAPVRALSFTRGETEYAVSWLPLGGYVKMASREEEATSSALEGEAPAVPVPPDRMFEAQPIWKRIVVILAGVTLNAAFAWLVFVGLALKNGRQVDPVTTVGRVVDSLVPPGGEALRQLATGDRIVAVNGRPVASWQEVEEAIGLDAGDTVVIAVDGKAPVRLAIPHDAMEARLTATQAVEPLHPPVVGQVLPGRPGERAGIAVGDTVVAVDGTAINQWWQLVERLQGSAGRAVGLTVARGGRRLDLTVTPEAEEVRLADGTKRTVGRIGIGVQAPSRSEPYTVLGAVGAGSRATLAASTQIVRTLKGMVSGRTSARSVGGPILIGQMAAQSARLGLDAFLAFMALISVNLAVLNLLPIPILDGGQLVFLLAEAVIRRPLSVELRSRLVFVGLVLVGLLMVLAFSNDLLRLFGR